MKPPSARVPPLPEEHRHGVSTGTLERKYSGNNGAFRVTATRNTKPVLEAVPAGAFPEKAGDRLQRYVIEKNNMALARFPANGAVVATAPDSLGLRLMPARYRARNFTRKVVNKLSRTLFGIEPVRQY